MQVYETLPLEGVADDCEPLGPSVALRAPVEQQGEEDVVVRIKRSSLNKDSPVSFLFVYEAPVPVLSCQIGVALCFGEKSLLTRGPAVELSSLPSTRNFPGMLSMVAT